MEQSYAWAFPCVICVRRESEASDLTPDKSSSGAASECITEPTAGAKSIFIWVQLMSLQLLTKVAPPGHQMWNFPLCACRRGSVCRACDCVHVNVCVQKAKGESISKRWLRGGIGLTTARSCLWRNNPVIWQRTHTLILFWQWFLAQLNPNLVSEQRATANRSFDKVVVLANASHISPCRRDERSPLMVSSHRPLASNSPSTITWFNTTGWWQMKDIYQSKCLHTANFVSQLTGARWILNT